MNRSIEDILLLCRENDRVCPLPQRWNELYKFLPATHRQGTGWIPALPLILAAWWEASDRQKQDRLELHIRWALEHSALDRVANFLSSLPEGEWHHVGD